MSNSATDKIARNEVDQANRNALVERMKQYNFIIAPKQFDKWRPTKMTEGEITGITGCVIIATDGNLGMFRVRRNSEAKPIEMPVETTYSIILGHIGHFTGKVETLFSLPKPTRSEASLKKAVKPRKTQEEKMKDFLDQLGL